MEKSRFYGNKDDVCVKIDKLKIVLKCPVRTREPSPCPNTHQCPCSRPISVLSLYMHEICARKGMAVLLFDGAQSSEVVTV